MNGDIKNKFWTWFERILLSGAFVTALLIYWRVAAFHTTVMLFMQDQKEKHLTIDNRFTTMSGDMEILVQWKVAKTGEPFRAAR